MTPGFAFTMCSVKSLTPDTCCGQDLVFLWFADAKDQVPLFYLWFNILSNACNALTTAIEACYLLGVLHVSFDSDIL